MRSVWQDKHLSVFVTNIHIRAIEKIVSHETAS